MTTPPATNAEEKAARRARKAERRERRAYIVKQVAVHGRSYADVARELGIARQTVHRLHRSELAVMAKAVDERSQEILGESLARLRHLWVSCLPGVAEGDHRAIRNATAIVSKMLDLLPKEATQVELSLPQGAALDSAEVLMATMDTVFGSPEVAAEEGDNQPEEKK